MSVSLVIVHYQDMDELRACIDSIDVDVELVVVDTSPEGESAKDPDVLRRANKVILAPANRGYGWACNLGIRAATADVVVVANSDVVFTESSIDQLSRAAMERSLCAPVQVAHADQPTPDNLLPPASLEASFARWTGVGRRRSLRERRAQLQAVEKAMHLVKWNLSGACLAAHKDVWQFLGGFEEKIWMYHEDIELSERARRKGVATLLVPSSRVLHTSGSSRRELNRQALSAALWGEQIATRSVGNSVRMVQVVQVIGCLSRALATSVQGRRDEARMWISGTFLALKGVDCDPRTS